MERSDMTNTAGTHIDVHMVIVKLDAHPMAGMTRLTMEGISAEDFAGAKSVLDRTAIAAAPPAVRHGRRRN
jgi:hypothetical protein